MTVEVTTSRWNYTGNGVTTAFTYDNRIFASTDLKVYVDGTLQTLTTHYSVSGVADEDGGEVTFVTAPANATSVVIVRDVPAKQLAALADGDAFPAEVVNDALDKLMVVAQQALTRIGRTLRQPDSDAADISEMPVKASRASKFLGFDANGNPVAAAGTSADLGPVSAFVNTLLDDADAAAARATLAAIGLTDMPSFRCGLAAARDAGDLSNDITIQPGAMTASSAGQLLRLSSALTKRIDAAFAVGSGNGGFGTGIVLTNGQWYDLNLIRRDSDGAIDAYFDEAGSTAHKPAGW
ncbi:MAG TPA: hypothetical protein VEC14_04755, partial [Reyranellaceae bacterium]|nr:hypothetical protein [Reyranellaceae bacterium]